MYKLLVTTIAHDREKYPTTVSINMVVISFDTQDEADFAYKELNWSPEHTQRIVERLYPYEDRI